MKRLLIASLVLLIAGIIGIIALPWLISSETVRASLLDRAREITGREMRFSGDPRVSFSPFLGIEIRDVVFAQSGFANDSEPILTMPYLRGKLNLGSALAGRIVIDEFQFIQPKFNLTLHQSGRTSWSFPNGKVWRALREARELRTQTATGEQPDLEALTNIRLGRFSVESGTIEYENKITGRKESVTNFNGSLLWPNTRAGWTFNGGGIWRGDDVTVNLTAARPIMLLAGGATDLNAEIRSDTVNLAFEGEANRFSDLFLSGTVTANTPSLRKMVDFFGGVSGSGATFLEFSASGNLSGTIKDIQLEDATISLDGNNYSGGLRLIQDSNKVNQLSGTLATESLALSPYFASLGSDEALDSLLSFLGQANIDLRLSAGSASIDDVSVTDLAGGISMKDGSLKFDMGNAAMGDGLLVGSFELTRNDNLVETVLALDGSGLNLAEIDILHSDNGILPSGSSDIRFRLSSAGKRLSTLKNLMNGEFRLAMKSGTLTGLNFSEIRSNLEPGQPTGENIEIGNSPGGTAVRDFILNVAINRGVGWIQNSNFEIEEFNGQLTGKADLRTGNLGVWGILRDAGQVDGLGGAQFFLGGTLDQPLFVPQPGLEIPSQPTTANGENTETGTSNGTN